MSRVPDPAAGRGRAILLLAGVRLFNGVLALAAPETLLRRLGAAAPADGAAVHTVRMFGVRTVLIGGELLVVADARRRRHAARLGVAVHASDTLSALTLGLHGRLPRRAAVAATGISAVNTALAVAAVAEATRALRSPE